MTFWPDGHAEILGSRRALRHINRGVEKGVRAVYQSAAGIA